MENVRNPNSQLKRKENTCKHHSGLCVEKVDLKGNIIETYDSIAETARINGISTGTIYKWLNGKVDQEKNRSKGFYLKKR